MFELISGGARHPFHDRTVAPQLVSVAVHGAVLSAAILLPVLLVSEKLPVVPTMMAFVAAPVAPPPPPPPPAPPPPQAAARAPDAKPVARAESSPAAAPIVAPAEIAPEPVFRGDEFGVEGGVEGGLEGGTLGGIVGGLVDAPPPPPPPPPPPALREPVRIGGQIRTPELIQRVEPVYPDIAVFAKVTGTVILEAIVAPDGTVESVKVLRGVKFLNDAALDAVKQWRYKPLVLNGIPTRFVLTVTLTFSIK
jgi:protein TonB